MALARQVNDTDNNYTRFACIGKGRGHVKIPNHHAFPLRHQRQRFHGLFDLIEGDALPIQLLEVEAAHIVLTHRLLRDLGCIMGGQIALLPIQEI